MAQQLTTEGKLKVGKMAPLFVLPSTAGGTSGPGAYRSRYNFVLAFLDDKEDAPTYLKELAALYPEIALQDARVLVVLIASLDRAKELNAQLDLPFPLLADEDGQVTARMLGGPKVAVCVADRYGELMSIETAQSPDQLPPPSTALDWLIFIQSLCPE